MKPFYKLQHPGGLWRHSEAVAWYHATPLTLALYMGYGTVWHGAMPHRNRVALGLGSAMPAPECQTLGVKAGQGCRHGQVRQAVGIAAGGRQAGWATALLPYFPRTAGRLSKNNFLGGFFGTNPAARVPAALIFPS
jgi:hypothetical protein